MPKEHSFGKPGGGLALGDDDQQIVSWIVIGVLSVLLTYSYLNTLSQTAHAWTQPEYSHGWLIPLFAAALLWLRREAFGQVPPSHRWWGAGLIVASTVVRALSATFVIQTVDRLTLIPCLLGVFILVGGLRAMRWAGPPILFLVFMYPLPGFLVRGLMFPLQQFATRWSCFALQTLGVDAYADGNRIMLDQVNMGVVDQCSGLRMLTIFIALAAAFAMITTNKPWWERLIILISAIPIALAVNAIRITVTGLLYNLNVKHDIAEMVFHDFAGWIMMPMALGLLFLEYQLLARLFLEPSESELVPVGFATPPRPQKRKGRTGA